MCDPHHCWYEFLRILNSDLQNCPNLWFVLDTHFLSIDISHVILLVQYIFCAPKMQVCWDYLSNSWSTVAAAVAAAAKLIRLMCAIYKLFCITNDDIHIYFQLFFSFLLQFLFLLPMRWNNEWFKLSKIGSCQHFIEKSPRSTKNTKATNKWERKKKKTTNARIRSQSIWNDAMHGSLLMSSFVVCRLFAPTNKKRRKKKLLFTLVHFHQFHLLSIFNKNINFIIEGFSMILKFINSAANVWFEETNNHWLTTATSTT